MSGPAEDNHPQMRSSEHFFLLHDALKEEHDAIVNLEGTLDRFVIHRSACCSLVKSYRIAFEWIEQLIRLALSHSSPQSSANLSPSLHELLHHMLQARIFLESCMYDTGYGWVQRAVLLALGTDARHQHLEELEWCIYVINWAVKHALIEAKAPDHVVDSCNNCTHVIMSIRKAWVDVHERKDRAILLSALDHELKAVSCLTTLSNDPYDAVQISKSEQKILIQFLKRALSGAGAGTSEHHHHDGHAAVASNIQMSKLLPRHLLVDHSNITNQEVLKKSNHIISVQKVLWCGGEYAQKEFKEVHDATAFSMEVAIHAKCRHPNVVQLIGYTENPIHGNYSMLLELEEATLTQYLAKCKSAAAPAWHAPNYLSPFVAVDLMLQIAKGMEFLCRQGIHHRDLKPANVLLSYSGSSNKVTRVLSNKPDERPRVRLKVSDYGGSRQQKLQKDFELETLSDSDVQPGATDFTAPEAYRSGTFTEKADVFSFAMVCYEILTGEAPYLGARLRDRRDRLVSGERPQLPSHCPSYLVDLIKQCWHRNPEERPAFTTISRGLRHLMAVLLISADSNSTNARGLLTNMYSSNWIETQLHSQLGTNWPHFGHCTSSTPTSTSSISLHMSWYQTAIQQAQCCPTQPSIKSKVKITKLSASGASMRSFFAGLLLCGDKDYGDVRPSPTTIHTYPDRYSNGAGSVEALKSFTYKELYAATHRFDKADQIGKGSSGCVFKGKLGDGRMVAVKVMEGSSKKRYKDGFFTELASLGKLRHCNLVPLLGWCWEKGNLILVYEYISRGDLHRLLFGHVQKLFLSLEQRYKIVYGLASALHYLHFQCAHPILHRDVNPNNILLDNDYNARLGDFGLAIDLEHTDAQVTTCAKGTVGYIAPEYVLTHKLGPEADVYSFGVVVLEVVCGKRLFKISPGEVTNVVPFVRNLYTQNRLLDAGHERLSFKTDKKEDMERLLLLGLTCTQCNIEDHPNMERVLRILSKEVQPPTPAHAPYGTL